MVVCSQMEVAGRAVTYLYLGAVYLPLITAQGEAGRASSGSSSSPCEWVVSAWVELEPPRHLLADLQRNPGPVMNNADHFTSGSSSPLHGAEPSPPAKFSTRPPPNPGEATGRQGHQRWPLEPIGLEMGLALAFGQVTCSPGPQLPPP